MITAGWLHYAYKHYTDVKLIEDAVEKGLRTDKNARGEKKV